MAIFYVCVVYFQQKEEFVKRKLAEKKKDAAEKGKDDKAGALTPEEMSEFYKKFLDDNYQQHVQYNKWGTIFSLHAGKYFLIYMYFVICRYFSKSIVL